MPVQDNPNSTTGSTVDDQSGKGQLVQSQAGRLTKEQEQSSDVKASEAGIIAEIKTRAEGMDQEAIEAVRGSIEGIRRAVPEPEIPPDVADAGVISPQLEADKVIRRGTTLELPITEEEYKRGLHQKVAGVVVNSVIVGASSLVGLALWAGRVIKKAHKHALKLRVIFRRKGVVKDAN